VLCGGGGGEKEKEKEKEKRDKLKESLTPHHHGVPSTVGRSTVLLCCYYSELQ